MSDQKQIEARLDRSLRNQVAVPKLGKAFDAGVWSRIEAEAARKSFPVAEFEPSRAVRASRWLALTNTIGIAVTLGIVLVFVLRTFGSVDTSAALDVAASVPAVPAISENVVSQWTGALGQILGLVALVFGLSFTSVGRRIRASFS